MKKSSVLLLSMILIVGIITVSGCGDNKEEEPSDSGDVYSFSVKGVSVPLGTAADGVIAELDAVTKQTAEHHEAASCAFEGLDKTYFYSGFEVHTYEVEKVDHILQVLLTDDSVGTAEGLYIGSDISEAEKLYGEGETDGNFRKYVKGDTELKISVEGGKVSEISYVLVTGE